VKVDPIGSLHSLADTEDGLSSLIMRGWDIGAFVAVAGFTMGVANALSDLEARMAVPASALES